MPTLSLMKRRLQGYAERDRTVENVDLRSMAAFQSTWENCTFTNCKMGLADLRSSRFVGCTFFECSVYASNFSNAQLTNVVFADCDFEQAVFVGAMLRDVRFMGCRMAYSVFDGATLRKGVVFGDCNLHGAGLDFLEADHPAFTDSSLWGVKQALGCQFWNGQFDEEQCRLFLAMVARAYPESNAADQIATMAGDTAMKLVRRLMDEKGERDEQ